MNFIGNKNAINFVNKVLKDKSFSQAYLFSGPESVGKFFLVKAFAIGMIEEKELSFDEHMLSKLPLDLVIVSPQIEEKAGKKREKEISIESVRNAQREMSLFPYSGKRRVLIVDNAHKMNISAQNALLKILEEPNSTSVIVLVTHEESKILPTIKSRCQKVVLSLVGKEEMRSMEHLVDKSLFEKYEIMSMGRPGLFISFLEKSEYRLLYEKACDDFEKIFELDINQKFLYAEKMSKDTSEAIKTLNVWMWILRKKFFEKGNNEAEKYYSVIERIGEAVSEIKNTNANTRLILENLLLKI